MKYIVISPVKDEARNIERTLQSMVQQTLKPLVWVVVDDGSSDQTPELVKKYADTNDFVKLLKNERRSARQTGIAEVLAFNAGLEQVKQLDYDCVVKLDGDLSFEADYFEKLLARFKDNPKLGIASGVYLEEHGNGWKEISMPSYHASGASKVVRIKCWEDIGGFIAMRGWDTVDEIRAMARGWETTHFHELKMKHWKPEGVGMGMLRTCYMHGEIYYRTGGGKRFFVLKVINRLRSRPFILGGLAMFWGYLRTMLKRRELLVSKEEARCYRALLNRRLAGKVAK